MNKANEVCVCVCVLLVPNNKFHIITLSAKRYTRNRKIARNTSSFQFLMKLKYLKSVKFLTLILINSFFTQIDGSVSIQNLIENLNTAFN